VKVTSLATSRRGLFLGREAVALLERFHLQRVHAVNDAVELILQLRIGLDVQPLVSIRSTARSNSALAS